ncbi:urease accessory protein UreD [Thalassomonas haliotis]|uniref:Urease accessory protein UreD n=1 Tax=Thalassomonas haliotis TaxID=485448 RepID=A0ABY7VDG6_9GAMM|nr:urease accessory protein UreD [Thalassomonas haliotis]WDE11593.1 urease accessory protein UreD [Thalassomonas haliotis]
MLIRERTADDAVLAAGQANIAEKAEPPAGVAGKAQLKRAWYAKLALEFSFSAYGTKLSSVKRHGPLSVQRAFYPEGADCAHLYLLHPPAGIVSGDSLNIFASVNEKAHALLTTPGANRFYRARCDTRLGDSKQRQQITLKLAKQAVLENFPLETLIYNGADAVSNLDIHLSRQSSYLGWDIVCLGLPASDQPFNRGGFSQISRIYLEQVLSYHDRIHINPDNGLLTHPAGLGGNSVFGNFIIAAAALFDHGTQRQVLIDEIREYLEQQQAQQHISISDIKGILVARYLGNSAEQCRSLFISIWQLARPLCLNRKISEPRIWFT